MPPPPGPALSHRECELPDQVGRESACCPALVGHLGPAVASAAAADSSRRRHRLTHLATLYHDAPSTGDTLRRCARAPSAMGHSSRSSSRFLFAKRLVIARRRPAAMCPWSLPDSIALWARARCAELEHLYDYKRRSSTTSDLWNDKPAHCRRRLPASEPCSAGAPRACGPLRSLAPPSGWRSDRRRPASNCPASQADLGKPPGTDLRDGVLHPAPSYAVET